MLAWARFGSQVVFIEGTDETLPIRNSTSGPRSSLLWLQRSQAARPSSQAHQTGCVGQSVCGQGRGS